MRKFSDLHKAIEKSKGKDIHLKLRGLNQSRTILNRNYFWLLQLRKLIQNKAELLELRNITQMSDFQLEFARNLHNYLASVKSLVDHTRVLKRKLNLDKNFENWYKQQRKKLLGTDAIVFIQQLREYVQHYSLLPSGVHVKIADSNDSEKITLILDAPILRKFSDWKTESLRILERYPKNIDIFKLIGEYQNSLNKFYEYFYDKLETIFKKELAEFDELAKEYMAHHEKMIEKETKKLNSKLGVWDAPVLEDRIVCISDDYILSSQVSSCFNRESVYFVVLEPPRSLHKYWRNEFVKLNNVLAKIRPKKIIFVNVKSEIVNPIKAQLRISNKRYEYLNNQAEVTKYVDNFSFSFKGILECSPDRKKITQALLEAKRKKYRLVIKDSVDYESKTGGVERKHVVVSDSSSSLLPVVLANYAFSIDADIVFLNTKISYKPEEIYSILSDTRGNNHRAIVAKAIVKNVRSTLEAELVVLNKYKLVTFFTDDFQYGYFFPNLPTTHIFNRLLPSHFIADSIASPNIEVQSAVLIDPGFFPNSETNGISSLLAQSGVYVKELRDDKFSNSDLDCSIQFFPYDLLFICSHGDFPKGVRFKIKFSDKNNCEHIIVIDTLDEFNPTNKGVGNNRLIGVKTFTEFVELDGYPWYQKKYKKGSSKTVVEDFLALYRKDWTVLEKKNVTMNYCNIIVTKDPISPYYIPMIQSVSDPQSAPFIFNNACVSTYTICVNIIFAGASFYIGTVIPIKDSVAIKTAQKYFEKSVKQNKSLALSIWEALSEENIAKEDRVYTCIGCHFKKFSFGEDNATKLKERIEINIVSRISRIFGSNLEANVKDKHTDAVSFLLAEYNKI